MGLFTKNKKVNTLTRSQRATLNSLGSVLEGQIGQAGPQYDGPTIPTDNATQGLAFHYAPDLMQRIGATDPAIASMMRGESANAVDRDAYYRDAVLNPATQAYEDSVRQLEARYGGSFGQTGAFQNVLAENAARFGTGIGQVMANLALQGEDRSNQQRALGVGNAFRSNQDAQSLLGSMIDIGGVERGQAAEKNLDAYNQWSAQQAYNNPWLGMLGPMLGTSAFGIGEKKGLIANVVDPGGFLG